MTAVEWLENQIKTSKHYFALMKDINSRGTVAQPNIFEQAKDLEKQQIMDAFYEGMNCQNFDPNKGRAEIYYNETFKKK